MFFYTEIKKSIYIFADNEKEPEMKIGHPTDVKHVAHIGWDGPSVNSANSPSWVNFLDPVFWVMNLIIYFTGT